MNDPMEKCVLLSAQPKWCDLIFLQKTKTVEIRRTQPKILWPFRVVVYCTKDVKQLYDIPEELRGKAGKVIGEFWCPVIDRIDFTIQKYRSMVGDPCMTAKELMEYGKGDDVFGWLIDEPKLYDQPKSLKAFGLDRPPQSWRYVEEIKG